MRNPTDIARIEKVELREIWENEAYDFTVWLEENIDYLNEVLDLDLSVIERERAAGTFSVDLFCEDRNGEKGIIENQLGKSDHDHLGKLITYGSVLEAKTIIWIVADARPEHVRAVTWLNEDTSASFYLVKLEAVRINGSHPAPLMTLIVGPSAEIKGAGAEKRAIEEQSSNKFQFWDGFLSYTTGKTPLFANVSPSNNTWIQTGAGLSYLYFMCEVGRKGVSIGLYIDTSDANQNNKYFDQLFSSKSEIEKALGTDLEWMRLDHRKACRIRRMLDIQAYKDPPEDWPANFKIMIDAMIPFEKVMSPYIRRLKRT